jgi:hypothetical protein
VREKAVAVPDVLLEAAPGHPIDHAIDPAAIGPYPGIIESDLRHAPLVNRRDRAHDLDHIGRVPVVGAVPGAVQTYDQSFRLVCHHILLDVAARRHLRRRFGIAAGQPT